MSVNKDQISNQLQNRGQFAQIPNEIYKVSNLSNTARSIWIYLASEGPGWKSSYGNIARNMDMSIPTVRTGIDQLVAYNMIAVTAYAEGSDFELISSDKWNVSWKTQDVKAKTPIKQFNEANKETSQVPIKNFDKPQLKNHATSNKTNTTNTTNTPKELEAKASKQENSKESFFFQEEKEVNNSIPEYLNKQSRWYQHYLKSSYNEEIYNSLPEKTKRSLYVQTISLEKEDPAESKDKFVSALTQYSFRDKLKSTSIDELNLGDVL